MEFEVGGKKFNVNFVDDGDGMEWTFEVNGHSFHTTSQQCVAKMNGHLVMATRYGFMRYKIVVKRDGKVIHTEEFGMEE